MKKITPLVSICCITYNHQQYLRDCLDGIIMQKTTFSFEIIIHDDASTDSTQQIIREYEIRFPEIIKPIYQMENQYCKGKGILIPYVYPAARGKYIALCEGDDYWTDPYKLQKQVDILESDSSVGLVHTACMRYLDEENKMIPGDAKDAGSPIDLIFKNNIRTLTTCFRRDLLLKSFNDPVCKSSLRNSFGDYQLWLYFIHHSNVVFLPDITSVYRVRRESASHTTNLSKRRLFDKDVFEVKNIFLDAYHKSDPDYRSLKKRLHSQYVISQFSLSFKYGSHELFLECMPDIESLKKNKLGKYYLYRLCGHSKLRWLCLDSLRKSLNIVKGKSSH